MNGEVSSTSPVLRTRFATTAQQHQRILREYKRIAIVGLSPNPNRPSFFAAKYLKAAGYEIFPVNPGAREILGRRCYATLSELPRPIEIVDIFRDSSAVPAIVEEAIAVGAKVIWMQLGVIHEEAAARALDAGLEVVMDRCIKIEHARFFGGLSTLGLNAGLLSSRKRGG
jgi:predicted CoA-binding protein